MAFIESASVLLAPKVAAAAIVTPLIFKPAAPKADAVNELPVITFGAATALTPVNFVCLFIAAAIAIELFVETELTAFVASM
jgi:hypothetical protein